MQLAHAELDSGERLVGLWWPNARIGALRQAINSMSFAAKQFVVDSMPVRHVPLPPTPPLTSALLNEVRSQQRAWVACSDFDQMSVWDMWVDPANCHVVHVGKAASALGIKPNMIIKGIGHTMLANREKSKGKNKFLTELKQLIVDNVSRVSALTHVQFYDQNVKDARTQFEAEADEPAPVVREILKRLTATIRTKLGSVVSSTTPAASSKLEAPRVSVKKNEIVAVRLTATQSSCATVEDDDEDDKPVKKPRVGLMDESVIAAGVDVVDLCDDEEE